MLDVDALVAEKVMGWTRNGSAWDTPSGLRTLESTSFGSFRPSIDIYAAWEVVEKMSEVGYLFSVFSKYVPTRPGEMRWGYQCLFRRYENEPSYGEAVAAPLAVCLSALQAVGHKDDPPFKMMVAL